MNNKQSTLNTISKWTIEESLEQRLRIQFTYDLIKKLSFSHFLEFGSDTGYFTQLIQHNAKAITAVELNKEAVIYAEKTKACTNVTWIHANMLDFEFNQKYDGISFIESLYYLSKDDRNILLEKTYKHLSDQGYLIFGAPLQLPKSKWKWDESYYFKSITEIKNLLRSHNFKIIKQETVTTPYPLLQAFKFPKLYKTLLMLTNQLPFLRSRNITILAKKVNNYP